MRITNFPLVISNAAYPALPEPDARGSGYAASPVRRDDLLPAGEPVAQARSYELSESEPETLAAVLAAKTAKEVVAVARVTGKGNDSRSISLGRVDKALAAYQDHQNVSEREFLREIMGVDLYV